MFLSVGALRFSDIPVKKELVGFTNAFGELKFAGPGQNTPGQGRTQFCENGPKHQLCQTSETGKLEIRC